MPDILPFEYHSADHLRLVLQTGHVGIWELEVSTGVAIRNQQHDQIFGYDDALDEWTYELFLQHVVPDDRDRVDRLQKIAIEGGTVWSFDCAIRDAKGVKRWISASGRPLVDGEGKVTRLIGQVVDITETRQREERLALLTEELNHRVRNMLAVIKSIVRLSSRTAEDVPSFAKALEGRVAALSRSHRLMVSDASESLTPTAILEAEIAAFPGLDERIEVAVHGETALTGARGQGLSLVFHELTTNALKYGALSNVTGRVSVAISQSENQLNIEWRESGGPVVKPNPEGGFGSLLIGDAIGPVGTVDLRFLPHGVECDIVLDTD